MSRALRGDDDTGEGAGTTSVGLDGPVTILTTPDIKASYRENRK
jgi:hypothetical protein